MSGDARRGVTAHAAAPDAKPFGVDLGPLFQYVEHGAHRRLEVGAQLHLLPGHALAGTIERAGGEPALQKLVLEGEELLLGRIAAGVEQHAGERTVSSIIR